VKQIRLATEADAPAITAIYAPIVATTSISFEVEPPDTAEMARRIVTTLRQHPWLVCDLDGQIAGYVYASSHRVRAAYQWAVDTAVYVSADFRRMGVGRGLYPSLFRILAAQGYFNAYAGITLPNPGSVRLHEAVGFRPVGVYRNVGYKLGAWHDVGWWQLALRPHSAVPAPPLNLPDIRDDTSWDAMLAAGVPNKS
jgi:L-amino acid N-acyltransferase YncA